MNMPNREGDARCYGKWVVNGKGIGNNCNNWRFFVWDESVVNELLIFEWAEKKNFAITEDSLPIEFKEVPLKDSLNFSSMTFVQKYSILIHGVCYSISKYL